MAGASVKNTNQHNNFCFKFNFYKAFKGLLCFSSVTYRKECVYLRMKEVTWSLAVVGSLRERVGRGSWPLTREWYKCWFTWQCAHRKTHRVFSSTEAGQSKFQNGACLHLSWNLRKGPWSQRATTWEETCAKTKPSDNLNVHNRVSVIFRTALV